MALYKTSMLYCFTLGYSFNVDYRALLFKLKKYNNVSLRSYMKISVHVEADDSKMVGAGHIGDDALSAFPLLRHSHPHVPIPQLQEKTHREFSGTWKGKGGFCTSLRLKIQTLHAHSDHFKKCPHLSLSSGLLIWLFSSSIFYFLHYLVSTYV